MRTVLFMLLVLLLSFSALVTAESLDGLTISQENILTQDIVENQAVTAPVSEVVDFVVYSYEQVQFSLYPEGYFNTMIVTADPYIRVEMEIITGSYKLDSNIYNIENYRGGILQSAGHC
jgi:hypothetical protein